MKKDELEKAIVVVKKIRKHNPETLFTIAETNVIKYEGMYSQSKNPIVVGSFPTIYVGDEFEIEGYWTRHYIYGHQFNAVFAKRTVPRTKKSIINFISRQVKGVGVKTAERIVEALGVSAISKIKENHECLLEVKGINLNRAMTIHETLVEHDYYEKASIFILSNGGDHEMVLWAYNEFGSTTIRKIRENPYLLLKTLTERSLLEVFEIAETFAQNLNFDPMDPLRIEAILLTMIQQNMKNRGDVYIPKKEIIEKLPLFIQRYGLLSINENDLSMILEDLDKTLENLIIKKELVSQDLETGIVFYLPQYLSIENRLINEVKRIQTYANGPLVHESEIEHWINKKESNTKFKFAEKQKQAIFQSLKGGISILTGGPGTGKTQTISAILECLLDHHKGSIVELLAPTGRAAKRMTELTGLPAQTIHRAVGIGRNILEDDAVITADLIVVDEMSMSDIYITFRLFKALENGSSILLVGDVDQLPSVGPGLIFRDFIDSQKIKTTMLNEVFRQSEDSYIAINAHLAKDGYKIGRGIELMEDNTDFFFIQTDDDEVAENLLIKSIDRFLELGYKLEEIKVLSPLNIGSLGTWRLNNVLQSIYNPLSQNNTKEFILKDTTKIRIDDFVLQNKNNKELDVMNGDIGVVQNIVRDQDKGILIEVLFDDDRVVSYDVEAVEELSLAYVTTIHKSQGSEYPVVIVPITNSLAFYMNRNLIYTAWTRAKNVLVNIGSVDAANQAIDTTEQVRRYSQVKEKLISTL